jgi:hypothetical protein
VEQKDVVIEGQREVSMATIRNERCDPFWKSVGSRLKKWCGRSSGSVFYVVYPPLEDAEEIRNNPERCDPTKWFREEDQYAWFHEAHAVAQRANKHAGIIVALVIEKPRARSQ